MNIKRSLNLRRRFADHGFSLLVTLLMMVLLSVVVLGLLSLATISMRESQHGTAMAAARANARLAMQLALNELQKTAGADRRVTATGGIDKEASAARKHYTGVWSTEGWKANAPGTRTFLGWLASANTPLTKLSDVRQGAPLTNAVTLVGEGTLGAGNPDLVKAEMIETPAGSAAGSGRLAWWVGDDSVKARYDLPDKLAKNGATDMEKRLRLVTPQRTGIQAIEGLTNYGDKAEADATSGAFNIQKAISLNQAGLFLPVSKEEMNRHFHDVTTYSRSLLTDVRTGGFKHDLSLAFELPLSDFHAVPEFSNSKERNNTSMYPSAYANNAEYFPGNYDLGYLFQIPHPASSSLTMRGPTWDLLRNHYRSYKREWEALSYRGLTVSGDGIAARPSLPFNFGAGSNSTTINSAGGTINAGSFFSIASFSGKSSNGYWNSMKATTGSAGSGTSPKNAPNSGPDPRPYPSDAPKYNRPTSSNITPIVTRFTLALGVGVDRVDPANPSSAPTVGLTIDPFLTIWNPYDRPLTFSSIGCFFTKFNAVTFNITAGTTKKLFRFDPNYIGSGAYQFALPAGSYTLAPGEVKLLGSANGITQTIDKNTVNCISGMIGYDQNSKIFLRPDDGTPLAPVGGSVTVETNDADTGGGENQMVDIFLMYGKGPGGSTRDPVKLAPYPPASGIDPAESPSIDESHIQRLCWRGKDILSDSGFSNPYVKTVAAPATVGSKGGFICAIDVRQDNTGGADDTAPYGQFNPRAQSINTIDYSGNKAFAPNWSRKIVAGGAVTDLQLGSVSGNAYWGSSNTSVGQRNVVMFEIPRAPLTSLGSLQHADAGFLSNHPAYMVGNSLAPASFGTGDLTKIGITRSTGSYNGWVQPHFDMSWAANDALWDRYFFSGANYGDQSPNSNVQQVAKAVSSGNYGVLANPRYRLIDSGSSLEADLAAYDRIASRLAYEGGFNVNSTSVDAWKAILSSLDNQSVPQGSGTTKEENPLSRWMSPSGTTEDRWKGFHSLKDAEVAKLAAAIVDQVRERGPFMGVADFVNRRLENDATRGGSGALQVAIEKAELADAGSNLTGTSEVNIRGGGAEAGIAGALTQGDVLASLGTTFTARGDTFVIRSYGETRDSSGTVTARAWCEAVVQRVPTSVVPLAAGVTDTIPNPDYPSTITAGGLPTPQYVPNPALPADYLRFGRRFEVVSFRWLSPSEV